VRHREILVALLLFMVFGLSFVEYRTDDTYIFLRYSSNLISGHGLAFNPGEPVYGFTSVLWVLLLAIPIGLGVPALVGAKVLALLLGVMAIVGFGALARRRLVPPLAGLATIAFAANAWLVRWSAAAMESALTTALVVWGLARHADEVEDEGRAPLSAVILAMGVLARPEVGLLFALALASDLLGGRRARRRALLGAALAALVLVPWYGYALNTFGALLPETAEAKGRLTLTLADLDPLLDVGRIVATTSGLEALLLLAAAAVWVSRRALRRSSAIPVLRRHGVALGWLAGLPLLYLLAGFDVLSRYALPLIPVVILYGFAALASLVGGEGLPAAGGEGLPTTGRRLRLACAVLTLLVVLQNGAVLRWIVYPHTHSFTRGVEECLGELGRWCRVHTPPGTSVAIADIGAFGYYSERRVLDLAGLVSPELLPIVNEHPIDEIAARLLFADRARPQYLVDRHPDPERLAGAWDGTFEPITWCRVEGLGVRAPASIAYTLYRLRWDRYQATPASERGGAAADQR
jgi:hypothetical protein